MAVFAHATCEKLAARAFALACISPAQTYAGRRGLQIHTRLQQQQQKSCGLHQQEQTFVTLTPDSI